MIALIKAKWHEDIVDQAVESFITHIQTHGYQKEDVEIVEVPGSLEFPFQAKLLANTGKYQAIVCCGLIVDGGIYRHEFVAKTVIEGIVQVGLETGVPVLSVALTPKEFRENSDVHEDFFKNHFILKGQEAADAAVQMIENIKSLRSLES